MEEDEQSQQQQQQQQQRHSSSLQQYHQRQQQQGGHLSKAARKQARKARKAATASRVQGLQGMEVLAALGDDPGLSHSDECLNEDDAISPSSAAGAGEWSDGEEEGGEGSAAAAGGGGGLSHLLSDDAEMSMIRLAKELCATFPNNVEQLVDLTGRQSAAAVCATVQQGSRVRCSSCGCHK
jgi:hypothetical protein